MDVEDIWTGCECGCDCCGPSNEYNDLHVTGPAEREAILAQRSEIPLRVGDVVYDDASQRFGTVMDLIGGTLYLRPVAGGREWVTAVHEARRASPRQPRAR
jgi:hypothetical protein